MNKDTKKKKNPGSGLALIIFLIAFLSARSDKIRELIYRLRDLPSASGANVSVIAAIAVAVLVIIVVASAIPKARRMEKKKFFVPSDRGGTAASHSHDRITGYTAGTCSDEEHWRKQLDGFLAAGIIERSEYRALLEKRKISYTRRF